MLLKGHVTLRAYRLNNTLRSGVHASTTASHLNKHISTGSHNVYYIIKKVESFQAQYNI